MTKRILTLALALMASTALFAQTQTARTEAPKSKTMTMLQGTWVFTSMNGQDVAATGGPEILVTITDNKYTQTIGGEFVERGTFKIDETKKPMTLDLSIAEGDSAGKSQVGVFEVSETTMKAKLAEAGETTRPTNLNQEEGFFIIIATKRK